MNDKLLLKITFPKIEKMQQRKKRSSRYVKFSRRRFLPQTKVRGLDSPLKTSFGPLICEGKNCISNDTKKQYLFSHNAMTLCIR